MPPALPFDPRSHRRTPEQDVRPLPAERLADRTAHGLVRDTACTGPDGGGAQRRRRLRIQQAGAGTPHSVRRISKSPLPKQRRKVHSFGLGRFYEGLWG